MSTVYKGALRGKRKNELVEMASALGLPVDDDSAKRDDVETLLKDHLLKNRTTLQSRPTWAGIYHSIDQSDKRAARSSSAAVSPDSDVSDEGGRKHTQKGARALANGTPLRRASNAAAVAEEGAANIAHAITAKARRSIEDLGSAFRSGAVGLRDEVREEIDEAASEVTSFTTSVQRSVRRVVRRVETRSQAAVVRARTYLSDAQHITALLLIIEAVVLVSQIMPLTSVKLGQSTVKTFVKSAAGKGSHVNLPRISVSVPNAWALLTYQFWRPVALWTGWTVGIPLLAAHLITFDRKHEPSALTFNLIRLTLLSTLSKTSLFFSTKAAHHVPSVIGVAAGEVKQVSASYFGSLFDQARASVNYDFVAPYVSLESQVLFTSLAAAFAAYEVVANRPRAA